MTTALVLSGERAERRPSEGVCYGCRHDGDTRFSTSGHCLGTGDMEPTAAWPGFKCTCACRTKEGTT